MNIRKAELKDLGMLVRLLAQLGYADHTFSAVAAQLQVHMADGYSLMVSEIDGEVVGFIAMHFFTTFHRPGNLGRITAFCVDEKFRGQGVGRQLLTAAEQYLKSQGCLRIEVTSNNRRTEAHQFYIKRGYQESSRRFIKTV